MDTNHNTQEVSLEGEGAVHLGERKNSEIILGFYKSYSLGLTLCLVEVCIGEVLLGFLPHEDFR